MTVAVVIPAYNEAATIGGVVRGVKYAGTVVVVDDASTDDTVALAEAEGGVVVRHQINRGYDGALQSGFEKAADLGVDVVVTFDADGQHDPAVLTDFLEPLNGDTADLVLGIRPAPARFSERLFNLYGRWCFGIDDLLCGLKAYRMELFREHGRFDGTQSIGTELALASLRRGARVAMIEIPIERREGVSRFGSRLSANGHILRALLVAVGVGLYSRLAGRKSTISA